MSVKREMWLMCPCGCEEYSQKTVVEHMERVHPEMLFKCNANQCGRLFWKLCDLKEHIVKNDNHRNFRRDHENLFNVEEFLDKQSHSYTRQFLGLKASNSKLATEGLIEYPVDLKEYRCRVCKANKSHFSSFLWSCATRHVKKIHSSQPSILRRIKYKCRECGRDDFCTDSDLQNHIEVNHGPALQISTKSRLSATIKLDSESEIQIMEVKSVSATESWYESSAPQPSGPPLHSVHTHENGDGDGEICHPCSFCKSRIPESESSFHLKIHYDELFKCDICQLGFEKYGKVVQHLKTIHKVGERFRGLIGLPMQTRSLPMLKCGVEDCGRKFIGQQNEMDILMDHVTKSHGQYVSSVNNVRFFCRICEDLETFDSLADVEDHIKYKHRRQLVTLNSSSEEDNEKVSEKPCSFFNNNGSCKFSSGHYPGSGGFTKQLHICSCRLEFLGEVKNHPAANCNLKKKLSEGRVDLVADGATELPCNSFNSGNCVLKSGHRLLGETRLLHICKFCFEYRGEQNYHTQEECKLKKKLMKEVEYERQSKYVYSKNNEVDKNNGKETRDEKSENKIVRKKFKERSSTRSTEKSGELFRGDRLTIDVTQQDEKNVNSEKTCQLKTANEIKVKAKTSQVTKECAKVSPCHQPKHMEEAINQTKPNVNEADEHETFLEMTNSKTERHDFGDTNLKKRDFDETEQETSTESDEGKGLNLTKTVLKENCTQGKNVKDIGKFYVPSCLRLESHILLIYKCETCQSVSVSQNSLPPH